MSVSPVWRLDGVNASLVDTGATLNVERPQDGVSDFLDGSNVLGVTPAIDAQSQLVLSEAFVRGDDLIARYQPRDDFPFRTEIYWRAHPESAETGPHLSLILSVETDLLDAHPELLVLSSLALQELVPLGVASGGGKSGIGHCELQHATALLAPSDSGQPSWFEAVHPTDGEEATLEAVSASDGRRECRWRLFSVFLEKGVIRRARVCGARLPVGDLAHAAGCYARFATQAPPLTV